MSMYTALSALTSQQTKLDVIGNNIANVSTVAYKSQDVSFSDLLSQTLSGATAANEASNTGGTNAQQVGLGVSIASVTTDTTVGSTESTGVGTDVSIDGSGYFILEGSTADTFYFTRAGNFGVDSSGNLVVDGYKVCGWEPDSAGNIDTQSAVSGLNLYTADDGASKQTISPEATSYATLKGTLNSSATAQGTWPETLPTTYTSDASSTITVYNALGDDYDVTVSYTKCATGTVYTTSGDAAAGTNGENVTIVYWKASDAETDITASGSGYLMFDSNGKLLNTTTSSTYYYQTQQLTGTSTPGYTAASATTANNLTVSIAGGTATTVSLTGVDSVSELQTAIDTALGSGVVSVSADATTGYLSLTSPSGQAITVAGTSATALGFATTTSSSVTETITLEPSTSAITVTPDTSSSTAASTSAITVDLDMTGITLSSGTATVAVKDSDGYAAGTLEEFTISSDGTITGSYSNGETQVLGQIALAVFENAAGLDKVGSNVYQVSANSGEFTGGVVAGSSGSGDLNSGTLEASNVDLSEQFAGMMVAERAYQAASKMITVTDEMMQTVINMVS